MKFICSECNDDGCVVYTDNGNGCRASCPMSCPFISDGCGSGSAKCKQVKDDSKEVTFSCSGCDNNGKTENVCGGCEDPCNIEALELESEFTEVSWSCEMCAWNDVTCSQCNDCSDGSLFFAKTDSAKDPKARYYDAGGLETLDIIKAKLTPEQYEGFLLGNQIKYACRANFKNHLLRDMEKVKFYSTALIKELES